VLERSPFHPAVETAASHRLEILLIPAQLLVTHLSLAEHLGRSGKGYYLARNRAGAGAAVVVVPVMACILGWGWRKAKLQGRGPTFGMGYRTNAAELILFHTPPPVRSCIKKLA
jgi:hypothetical protein